MGKIDEAKGCLKVAMMSFDKGYDIENIEMPPVTEFFSNKIPQREEPKTQFHYIIFLKSDICVGIRHDHAYLNPIHEFLIWYFIQ